jgi:hypothetical protein
MTTLLHKLTIYLAVAFFVSSFLLFMMDTSGSPSTSSSVVGDAAREGELNVPIQEDPLQMPAETPAETPGEVPAETPAGGAEQSAEENTDEGGGN